MKKILAQISLTNKNYKGLIKYLKKQENCETIAGNLHNNMFDIVASTKPDTIILPLHEYTQEFHNFILESTQQIVLVADLMPEGNAKDVLKFLESKTNIKMIVHQSLDDINNAHICYDKLYDPEIFHHTEQERNNKIAVLLSNNNQNNLKIEPLLFPSTNLPILCFNNRSFDCDSNLGALNDYDLNLVLNTFWGVVDIDQNYELEAQSCLCSYLDVNQINLNNIYESPVVSHNFILSDFSYESYIKNKVLDYIGV